MPKDDPTYPYLKAMQDAGAGYTDEKVILSQQNGWEGPSYGQLFRYSGADEYVLDPASQNKAGTRLAGVAQAGLGVAGVVASSTLCTTGLGCVATAIAGPVSADYAQAGARQAITGNATTPYGEQVLQSLGLSPQAAAYTYAALGIAPTLANALALNKAAAEISKYSQLARASYSEFKTAGLKDALATPQVQSLVTELRAGSPGLSEAAAQKIAAQIVESGRQVPLSATATPGSVLIKAVPKGEGVSSYTPYWMSPEQARAVAVMPPAQAGQALGLPAGQAAIMLSEGLDFYAITPKAGMLPKVFVSDVAHTLQGVITTSPFTQQVIVPNRSLWNAPQIINPLSIR